MASRSRYLLRTILTKLPRPSSSSSSSYIHRRSRGINLLEASSNPPSTTYNECLIPYRSFCSPTIDQTPAAIDYHSLLQEDEFHKLANSTIYHLQEKLEEYGDNVLIDGFDVEYGNEVLTLKLGALGTYVLNKQTPNRQIWMSSPVSGPSRFDWDGDAQTWIYRRNKETLLKVIETELEQLCGIEVKPKKSHPYHSDNAKGTLYVTQATLGAGASTNKCSLQCSVGHNNPILLCTLIPNKLESFALNLEFTEEDLVTFSVIGARTIHLSVVITELSDDEKPANENVQSKQQMKKNQPGSSEDKQIPVKSKANVTVVESEDEDGFPIDGSNKAEPIVQELDEKAVDVVPEDNIANKDTKKKKKKNKAEGGDDLAAGKKRKAKTTEEDAQVEKNKKQKGKVENNLPNDNQQSNDVEDVQKQVNEGGADIEMDVPAENISEKKKAKKKNKKKKKNADSDNKSAETSDKDSPTKPARVRTFGNGLVIEDVALGKPGGKKADIGKKVSVTYIGKLQKDGKIFDSNIQKAPFKFRLGVGEVIKGWDVGINGMRVGDKRKLTIPPSMGYGSRGAGGKIPPNAWLEFDVELLNVN
ncbi:hypothetical protein ACFE04_027015 [Oxalis oulophora]